jgi:hypothetical protein
MARPATTGSDQRREPRRQVSCAATIQEFSRETNCVVRDISPAGIQLLVEKKPPAPRTPINVKIARVGFLSAEVRWTDGNRLGASFDKVSPAMADRINRL